MMIVYRHFLILVVALLATCTTAYAPLGSDDIAGVWCLTHTQPSGQTQVFLKLWEDGSFATYGGSNKKKDNLQQWVDQERARGSDGRTVDDDRREFKGSWGYHDGRLLLAADRSADTTHDTLYAGTLVARSQQQEQDVYLSVPEGQAFSGKFVYPRRHPSFFEQPIFAPKPVGGFTLQQVLGKLNTRDPSEHEEKVARYHKKDFHDKRFLLTVSPLPRSKKTTWNTVKETDEEEKPFDIRVMPIQFFQNNTFTAVGMNKVLRGRFGTTGEEKEKLWFVVSLFGAGRSMKGSVYSEGQGLSHDDRRSYVGDIEKVSVNGTTRFFVSGTVIYGTDFVTRTAASVGTFIMKETSDSPSSVHDDEDAITGDNDAFQ